MKPLIKILFAILITIFLCSCSKDTIVNTGSSSGPFTLNGTIDHWTYGGNIMLKAELFDANNFMPILVLDSNVVSTNGAFTLKLRDVPDSLLYLITFHSDSTCVNNVTVNPPSTKSNYNPTLTNPGSEPDGLDLYNDSNRIGFIYRSNYGPDTIFITGWYVAYYLYLNQNVSITGSIICNYYEQYHDTTIYDFSGTRGWNKVVVFINSLTDYSYKITVSANEPAGGKWRAYPVTNDALSNKLSLSQRMFSLNNKGIHCR